MSFQDLEKGRSVGIRRGGIANGKQDPTQAVASGIFQINTAVSTFHRLVNTLGTPKDTPELREKLHKTRLHIGQLVKDTSAKLKQASETDHHAEVSASKKITDAKLAKDFQAVLKEFQKAQRLAAERETAYSPFVPQAVPPSSYAESEIDERSGKHPEQHALLVESRSCSCTMELLHLKIQIYAVFGIIMFFLANIGSCKHIPKFTESYISKPYFEKYGSLLDSFFQDFLAHEVPIGLCEVSQNKNNSAPKLSILNRRLIGEGSHRRLSTSIRFDTYQESVSKLPDHYCEAIIVEKLPFGVFADPFELQDLLQRSVYMEASVFGDTNLELPSIQSNRSLVEIHMDIGLNALTGSKHGLEINIELPIHARYPPLVDHGYSRIKFGQPDLFTRCSIEGKSSNQSCIFMSTDSTAKAMGDSILWEVPSGNKKHATTVSFFTFMSAILSALSIVLVSIRYSNFETDSKQS